MRPYIPDQKPQCTVSRDTKHLKSGLPEHHVCSVTTRLATLSGLQPEVSNVTSPGTGTLGTAGSSLSGPQPPHLYNFPDWVPGPAQGW